MIEADILVMSRRRCAICYALYSDSSEKKGQIAHLDHDSSNNDVDNLLFLCLEHHDEYDSTTRQSKGLSIAEVKQFRDKLYRWVESNLPSDDENSPQDLTAKSEHHVMQPASLPSTTPDLGELVNDLAAEWVLSEADVHSELERVRQLLEKVAKAALPSRQRKLLEVLITEDQGEGLPRRVVEVAAGYDYLSMEFYDEMSVLVHHSLASFEPEHDENVYLGSHEIWMTIRDLCDRWGVSIADLLRNPDPDLII